MAQKKVKTRIQNKYDTVSNWSTADDNGFTPLKGELIIYESELINEDVNPAIRHPGRVKVGDGLYTVSTLPFLNEPVKHDFGMILPQTIPLYFDGNKYVYTLTTFSTNSITCTPVFVSDMHTVVSDSETTLLISNIPSNGFNISLDLDSTFWSGDSRQFVSFMPSLRTDNCILNGWSYGNTVSSPEETSFVVEHDNDGDSIMCRCLNYTIYPPANSTTDETFSAKVTIQNYGTSLLISNDVFKNITDYS